MTDKISVEIDANTAKAVKALNDLITKLADLNASGPQAAKAIDAVERSAVKISTSLSSGTKSVYQQTQAIQALIASYRALNAQGLKNTGSITNRLGNSVKTADGEQQAKAAAAAQAKILADQQKAYQSYARNINATAASSAAYQQRLAYQTYANNLPAAMRQSQNAAYATYTSNIQASRAIDQQRVAVQGLANQRYALYDVARSWALVSAATLGASAAVVKVGIDYQKNFADVERTVGGTHESLVRLKSDLIGLSTELPTTFEDLTKIATLGGQLGIAPQGIEQFTEVVAKLTATTNLSAEAAGTALGRFKALFGISDNEFDNIASAILKVGVNSVATETQIVNTSTQISSMGKFAGLTAEQVVGLSGALASVGAAPELARGTVTRVFTQMATAVQGGGDALAEFARISGVSSEEFASTWNTPQFAATFQKFLKGIGTEGQAAIGSLKELGISSVRDVPLLLRLADAGVVVTQAFDDARTGAKDGTELNRQYAITAGTVAAKLQMLSNTLKGLFAGPGSAVLGPISGFLDVIESMSKALMTIANTGAGQAIGVIVISLSALIGIFLALRAAEALTTATAYAFITAQDALAKSSLGATGGLLGMVRTITSLTIGMGRATAAQTAYNASLDAGRGKLVSLAAGAKGAATAVGGIGTALKSLGWLAVIGAGVALLTQFAQSQAEAKQEVDALTASLDQQTGAMTRNTREIVFSALQQDGVIAKAKMMGLNLDLVTDAALGNTAALRELTRQQQTYQDAVDEARKNTNDPSALTQAIAENQQFADILRAVGGQSKQVAKSQADYADAVAAGVVATDDAGAAAEDLVGNLQDVINVQYELVGGTVAVQNSLASLGASLAENGSSFDAYSVGGRLNLAALQDVMNTMAVASGGDAAVLATNLAGLMQSLASYGVNTVSQLAFVQQAIAQLAGKSGISLAAVDNAARIAGNGLSQGFSKGTQKIKKAGKAAKDTAKEIKTLSDYANDLAGVFKNSFEIRFGLDQSIDSVADAFQKIADTAENARQSVEDATSAVEDANQAIADSAQAIIDSDATIQRLNATKTILEYQLAIAQQYGDTLRAADITAELAQNSADLADEQNGQAKTQKDMAKNQKDLLRAQNDLSKAQRDSIPILDGQTESSRDQRAAVLSLVQAYQNQVVALANSGLSTQEVSRRTAELKNQFIAQLTQMGYNRDEINRYAAAFDDLSRIIAQVPRNITVSANTDPAQRAIDEFLAANANRNINVSTSGGGGTFTPSSVSVGNGGLSTPFVNTSSFHSGTTNTDRFYAVAAATGSSASAAKGLLFQAKGGAVPEYHSSGGVHGIHPGGPRGTDTTPAWLTPGEFVMQRSAVQSLGLPFMNALNNQQRPQYLASGGSSGGSSGGAPAIQLVEILPTQIQQIVQGVSSELRVDGRVITNTTNANNVASARRGSN